MEALSLAQLADVVGARLSGIADANAVRTTMLCTDTRELGTGDVFVCLRGPNFDGHRFASQALEAGAAAVITEAGVDVAGPQLVVEDTRVALAAVGGYARGLADEHLEAVVAITGSNGKTSTKDLCAAALSTRWKTVRSRRSFNNSIGVPRTLFDLDPDVGALVAEVGTNAPGEIAELAAIVRPHVAVITNIQPAHLDGLSSLAGIAREKGALLDALVGPAVSILNRDDGMFEELAERAPGPVVSFGLDDRADVVATAVDCHATGTTLEVDGRCSVALRHLGRHAALNALAAIAAACASGVPLGNAAAALADVPPPDGRFEVRDLGTLTVIDDSYNANPGSVAVALDVFGQLDVRGRRIAVIGDMLELGKASERLHREVGAHAVAAHLDLLIAVGECAQYVADGVTDGAQMLGVPEPAVAVCASRDEAFARLAAALQRDDAVLVKASRGMHLEVLVGALAEHAETLR